MSQSDTDIPPLEPDVKALVARASRIEPAPAGAKARVWSGVEGALGDPFSGGGHDPEGAGLAGRIDASPSAPSSRLVRHALSFGSTFVLGGVVGALAMHAATPASSRSDLAGYASAEAPSPWTSPSAISSMGPAESPRDGVAETAPPSATRAPGPSSGGERAAPSPGSKRDALTEERKLLDLARSALEREDPRAALSAVGRHERAFVGGLLVQEREAMAVRALLLAGRASEARARAGRFRARFPDSVLLPALDALLLDAAAP